MVSRNRAYTRGGTFVAETGQEQNVNQYFDFKLGSRSSLIATIGQQYFNDIDCCWVAVVRSLKPLG